MTLHRLAVTSWEGGAQRLVPAHQLLEAALQRGHVQRALRRTATGML